MYLKLEDLLIEVKKAIYNVTNLSVDDYKSFIDGARKEISMIRLNIFTVNKTKDALLLFYDMKDLLDSLVKSIDNCIEETRKKKRYIMI